MVTETIKPGYKQTELGIIPEDWDVKKLGEVANVYDGTHQTPKYVKYGIPFFSVENVTNNNFTNTKFISEKEHKFLTKSFKIEKGDILMTRIGSIGDCKLIDWEVNASFYVSLALLKIKKGVSRGFICQYSKSSSFKREADIRSLQWAIPKKINLGDISEIRISIPAKEKEQSAIAQVLSDNDALVEQLNKLITKKKNIKQGMMQELLTGKKRLPGFNEEWKVKKIRELGQVITGSTPSTKVRNFWNGNIPWVTPTDINDKKNIAETERDITKLGLQQTRELPKNTVLITCIASIGKNAILKKEGACNQQINAIITHKKNNPDFIYYLMEKNKKYLLSRAGITATNIISKRDFEELEFLIPDKLEEQSAIAQVLSDMDAEIESLEQKRDKYLNIKKGMIQQLLTGRIRLI